MDAPADEAAAPHSAIGARALQVSSSPWRTAMIVLLLVILSVATMIIVPQLDYLDKELKTALYVAATTLLFGGLLGGLLRIVLEDVGNAKVRRADAATFVSNVLADLKAVYDRVGRAKIVIPAHQSVKTYGNEMRDLIESQVQLRNVVRALEGRLGGVSRTTMDNVKQETQKMEAYLDSLTTEFKKNYRDLSDLQRSYEERAKVIVEKYAEHGDSEPPKLPRFPWDKLTTLPELADFVTHGPKYTDCFYKPLDRAAKILRAEVAQILGYP